MPTSTYIGTSGWSYPTGYGKWRGIVYPPKWHGDELCYYAERLPAVEVNSSFYRMPTLETVRGWVQRTPVDFRFAVKLYRKFTHPDFFAREEKRSPEIIPEDIAQMRGVLELLAERGRLLALLVQYPEHFSKTPDHLSAMVRTLDLFRVFPLAVELRHASWDDTQGNEVLAHFSAARVRLDEPCYANLQTAYPETGNLSYWRFHGRNRDAWTNPAAGNRRYDYLYSGEEIHELAQAVDEQSTGKKPRVMFFNNHYHGQAIANAISLAARLGLPWHFDRFANLAIRFPELTPIVGSAGTQLRLIQ